MRNLIQLSCFLLINIAAVCSLQCMSCTNSDGLQCTGNPINCSKSDDVCTTSYYVEKRGDKVMSSWIVNGCGSQKECTDSDILTNKYVRVATGVACCKENNCQNTVALPAESTALNNLTCRSCFSTNSRQCYTNETVRCTGKENRCARFSIEFQGNKSSTWNTRGCATEGFCNMDIAVIKASEVTIIKACTDASSHLQRNLFLLFASLVFLVKPI